jgi:hypothetical protein
MYEIMTTRWFDYYQHSLRGAKKIFRTIHMEAKVYMKRNFLLNATCLIDRSVAHGAEKKQL